MRDPDLGQVGDRCPNSDAGFLPARTTAAAGGAASAAAHRLAAQRQTPAKAFEMCVPTVKQDTAGSLS
jgi:hypothetical protein